MKVRFWPSLLLLSAMALAGGCAQIPKVRLTLPDEHTLVRDPLVIHSDFPLASHHRLIEELIARRTDICRGLGLPGSDEPVYIYLFGDAERFRAFMRLHYPDFPDRRAFFVETDTRLIVYAHWGDRVAEDLRHEVSHAYLHAAVPNLPLWLDEGLAEYFEGPRGGQGMNHPHVHGLLARLDQGSWQPDVGRLEQIDSPFGMTLDEYAEAWAWSHFLLNTHPIHQELLLGYLIDLRRDGATAPLSVRLGQMLGSPDAGLIEHIRSLGATARR